MRHNIVHTVFLVVFFLLDFIVKRLLEWLNNKKEEILRPALRRYWPEFITPNILSGSRIVIGGFILWPLAYWYGFVGNYWILALLIFAALTDLIDGPVARALNQKSDFGSLLDKIADKFLVLPLGLVEFSVIDPWLAWISIAGMCVIMFTSISKYFSEKHEASPENIFGKWATAFYCIAILLPIWRETWEVARILGWMGLTFGLASAVYNFRKQYDISH